MSKMEIDGAGIGPSSQQNAAVPSRQRGRLPLQMRTLVSELSLLNRSDGSAKWSQDGSSVVAAVHGPRLANPRREDAEKAIVEVVFKPRAGIQGHREREMEHIIRRTLEGIIILGMHPRTSIMVVLQVSINRCCTTSA
ncbi:ribosomal protein S5 domain 2-type protein [Dunaliella salina]|uniref:Ribosomal protein S5 domain 2-type protein n=1 Tax=Dunaliella salina TaxID=3046 RepID=A0ABQ7H869_DUNSA|nr:ribosomal protein S5 domain 2-type protein [Dunaliella salina]|eukprot:KAF5843055.1 ribosomal protein S5 domain 2-type protein [Dunaliella salina]